MGEQGVQEGAEHASSGAPVLRISEVEVLFPTFTTWGAAQYPSLMMSLWGTVVLNDEI
jgi:hypothetical protein